MSSLCTPVETSRSSDTASGLSGGIIALIIIATLAVVTIAVAVIVYRLKRKRRWDGVYEYTGVSSDGDTTMLVSASKGTGPRFYDDDDDDLII